MNALYGNGGVVMVALATDVIGNRDSLAVSLSTCVC